MVADDAGIIRLTSILVEGAGGSHCLPVILGKPRPSGRNAVSGCTMFDCLCRNDYQVSAFEHQVCRVAKGRRGPDHLRTEPAL